jgi:hypothetical protein
MGWAAADDATPRVLVNDQPLTTSHPPITRAGVMLLPMRDVFEALKVAVKWYPEERKIEARRGEALLELWIMTPVAMVNHSPLQLDAPPLLVGAVTYVPLRLPAEAFGGTVLWDAATHTARVTTTP